MKSTGNRIEAIRKRQGLSRADLAVKLETTRMTVWRIETGKVHIRTDDLPKFARALKVRVEELVT